MSSIEIVSKFIPLALGIIMFGLGLTLTTQNFLYYRSNPKPVVIGTLAQMLLGPIFGFVLVYLFQLPPIFAVGIMLLAASPGGTTSGIITHLARGDVALSITLTAINSLIGTFSLPFIVYLSFNHFLGSEQIIPPPVIKIIQLMVVVLVPMAIGMFVNSRSPQFSKKAEPFIRKFAVLFLVVLCISGISNELENLKSSGLVIFAAVLTFNIGNLALGYYFANFFKLGKPQAITISFEVGIHNAALAIAIAMSPDLLNSTEIAIPGIFYSVTMLITGGLLAKKLSKQ